MSPHPTPSPLHPNPPQGEADGEEGERLAHELMGRAYSVPGASVHWYGKAGVAAQRKIGHITIVGRDNEECRQRLRAIDPGAPRPAGVGLTWSGGGVGLGLQWWRWQCGCAWGLRSLKAGQLPFHQTGCSLLMAAAFSPPLHIQPSLYAAAADAIEAASSRVASELQQGSGGAGGGGPKVGIIMGSDSDLATMKAAAEVLEEFGVPCELTVVSAHRCVHVRQGRHGGVCRVWHGACGAMQEPASCLNPQPFTRRPGPQSPN